MSVKNAKLVFEVSWEVCNKVGGIYTVIQSKARSAVEAFGDGYHLFGPQRQSNPDFEESDDAGWKKIREATEAKGIHCRFGRWNIPGKPKVVLVGFEKKYNPDQLLYQLWEDFGVDSLSGGWDYIEPVMFSYACGEVIEAIYNLHASAEGPVPAVAQFHEWMCGAGLLCLKRRLPQIGTVFTTHATVLGRALASSGVDIYGHKEEIQPQMEARAYHISAKYSVEAAAAREADCFTTVSDITALEAKDFLGRKIDAVLQNGLDIENIPDYSDDRSKPMESRRRILEFASRFLGKEVRPDTRILMISGLYEFHNKGIDVFLESIAALEKDLRDDQSVLALIFILAAHTGINPLGAQDGKEGNAPIVTHKLSAESTDPILKSCQTLGLRNSGRNRVNVIFMPVYLNGQDGLLNLKYYDALAGCDVGVFPSYYEPWGYTPLESAAYAVPTVTTNCTGFGLWAQEKARANGGVLVIDGRLKRGGGVVKELASALKKLATCGDKELAGHRKEARKVAVKAGWSSFYANYIVAYDTAMSKASSREVAVKADKVEHVAGGIHFAGKSSVQPHFRQMTAVSDLPKKIRRLREVAYNLWWTWNFDALELFACLDPKLWAEMGNNPVRMLEAVSQARLADAAKNDSYLDLYNSVLERYDAYMGLADTAELKLSGVKRTAPVAYFSAEYGIHECLPIYSGGLGVLSGDTLKAASDLNVPLVAVGLLYKNGYFRQRIDENGWQVAEYPENDFASMPTQLLRDGNGEEIQVSVELPGRVLNARVWEVKVGRITLYLLDSDVPRNTTQDRKVTSQLYCAEPNTRIEQEILLGIGGVRMLRRLGIAPSVYHMNEGHSAFLLFERVSGLMTEGGLSFEESCEVVRSSSVFTTHTPVEAGNERFTKSHIEAYFANFVAQTGISWNQFWDLGRKDAGDGQPFFMTVLALKLSHKANGVSRMHGSVSRSMWQGLWDGFLPWDIPIGHITNGVHMKSFTSTRLGALFDTYIGVDWHEKIDNADRWRRVHDIPDNVLWRLKGELKNNLINFIVESVASQWRKYGYSKTWREEVISSINPAALVVGFARRFAPYKRADLILSDLDRLDKIVNNPKRPVHIVFAGKSHPNDKPGIEIIKKVIGVCNDLRFRGKIFFLEDYDMKTARHLLQGCDVWLNNPRRPYEASGTSGEKVISNGGLNLSISDGWWCEGHDGSNGWTIGRVAKEFNEELLLHSSDEDDAQSLYSLIEDVVCPMYYDRDDEGIPRRWLQMVKNSIATLVPKFNAKRMLKEYFTEMFEPTALHSAAMAKDGYRLAKEVADWKRKIPMRFASVKITEVKVEGAQEEAVITGALFTVIVGVELGKLSPEEICVELVVGKADTTGLVASPQRISLKLVENKRGSAVFQIEHRMAENGQFSYGVRAMPVNKELGIKVETGLVIWG